MKNFDEYRNFYKEGGDGGIPEGIPEGMPTPKTFKEWAVAKLCGLDFANVEAILDLGPKTPIENYLDYAISQKVAPSDPDVPRT